MMKIKFFVIFILFDFIFIGSCFKNHHKRNITSKYLQLSSSSSSSSNVYRYEPIHLLEEPPIGTLIIDLANKLGLNLDTSDYKFRFYSPQSVVSNYFLIDQLTGHVKTQRMIDREYLCETKICGQCLTSNCTLTLEIVATLPFTVNKNNTDGNLPKQKFVSFDVIIEDKNEFAPQFTQSMLVLNVSEAAPLNFQIPIEGAIDRDSQFTQITYSLSPLIGKSNDNLINNNNNNNNIGSDDSSFLDNESYANEMKKLNSKIKLQTSPFSNQLNLILTEPFDYEKEKEYSFKILATDNGWPPLTGTCIVKLNIIDVNDNLPVFDRQEYEYRIDEGVTPGTRLVRVHAIDADDGINSLIKYSFAEQVVLLPQLHASSLLSQTSTGLVDKTTKLFHVDENTGWISSNTYLDFEYQPIYRLVVKAQDQGINSMPVYATVVIYLNDLNDNAPIINITVPDDMYKYENEKLYISEWTQPGTFLAQIIVTDPDSGLNGRVDVDLQEQINIENELVESNTFYIEHLFNNIYSLILKQVVDRENNSDYSLFIKAHDFGKPMLSTVKPFKILITDENDNAPKFLYPNINDKSFKFSLFEANKSLDLSDSWIILGKITCVDDDIGDNGKINYRLIIADNKTLFKINETSGELSVFYSQIDREVKNSYNFKVICEDNGQKKRLNSESMVDVTILDINDNKPFFEHSRYGFNIDENFNLYTKITQFNAIDLDEPLTANSRVNYEIIDSTISLNKATEVFGLNKETGELYLTKALDYETVKSYEFYIVARDFGIPQLESDKTLVRIRVLDVNDNAPILKWPLLNDLPLIFNLNQLYDNYINLNNLMFTINSTDADSNENSILKYTIEKQQKINFLNEDQFRTNVHLFECDLNNGTINGLFLKRFKTTLQNKQQNLNERLFDDLVGIYYLEINIQDSAKVNPLNSYLKVFLALNTNSTPLIEDLKLLKDFLNQTEIDNLKNNNDLVLLSLKKYVHNVLNLKLKLNFVDYNDMEINNNENYKHEKKFSFLDTIFSFHRRGNNHVERLFGENYRFILFFISITVIILLLIVIAVSVVACYRRKMSIIQQKKAKKSTINDSKNSQNTIKSDIMNINSNLLSSLIDIQSSSSDDTNNSTKKLTTVDIVNGVPTTDTLKQINKLRANVNDYELNLSSEDQTALLLYTNSPSSTTSSSTASNRQTTVSSLSSNQTNLSKRPLTILDSIDHIDENSNNYNTLRTFKNVTTLATPRKKIIEKDFNTYQLQLNDNNKYYTLPINNRQSVNESLINSSDESFIGTLRNKNNQIIRVKFDDNEIYSSTLRQMFKNEINKKVDENTDCFYDTINKNKYQHEISTTNNDENENINNYNEIPDYFFKNKKEFKKLACKNNIIDCKRLELPDEEVN